MPELRFAAISDVHGNSWALDSVLRDIDRRGLHCIVHLGDMLYGPLDPAGTARVFAARKIVSIRGNQDRSLVEPSGGIDTHPTWRYVRDQITDDDLRWLRRLPLSAAVAGGRIFICHGTPQRDDEYLLEDVGPRGVAVKTAGEVEAALVAVSQSLVLCGHSHVPRAVSLAGGRLVVNCGSVGLPAYLADSPFPHAMENRTPHARYAVLTETPEGWDVEYAAVAYDWETAARTAEAHGRPDWAAWLRTGRAS